MVKELRTHPVVLRAFHGPQLTSEEESMWGLRKTQTFLPPLELLFKDVRPSTQGVRLREPLQKVLDADTIQTAQGSTPVHRKTTSILDAQHWMRGNQGSLGLPQSQGVAEEIQKKMQSPHTAAQVGALASVVLSESGCPHFPKVQGVQCGIADKHVIDISDDQADLSERPWFTANIGKTFQLRIRSEPGTPQFQHTRSQRPVLQLEEDICLGEVAELEGDRGTTPTASSVVMDEVHAVIEEASDEDDSESTTSTAQAFEIESCECGSDASSFQEDVSEDGDESFAWAEIADIPVITTVMEKCSGTLQDLLEEDEDPSHHAAFVAQVVFALAWAQRTLAFTHNDLHGNNVMWVPTTREFMYQNLGGVLQRVPTQGRLMKIIDFERSVFQVRLPSMREARTFMSDQFAKDEEADGQQNCDPFQNPKYPEIKPNPSFDLVRLATSVFWDLFPEGPDVPQAHPLFSIFLRWMTLPDGTSILFRKERDDHDRQHGFHLYKAIARQCKNTAVPRKEPALVAFKVEKIPLGESCVVIEP